MPKIIDNFVLQDKIGHGQFGDVYSGFNQQTKMQVAIKTIKRQTIKGKFYELLENQIKVLKTCDNPYIMKLYALKKTANHYYLILEYCNGGDMLGKVKQLKKIPQNEVIKYFCQILTGFQTLVKHKIMHRDFKLANILLHDDNIKIADFGFSKLLNTQDYATTMLGSPLNMAPQVLGGNKYNNKADIWSIGACIYQMLFGRPPYTANNMVDLLKVIKQKPLSFPPEPKINDTLKDVLKRMLVSDVKRRISWNDLFTHPINRYLDNLVRKEIDLELIQDQSLMINTSKYYLKKNLIITKPEDIQEKAKMNQELVEIIKTGEKVHGKEQQEKQKPCREEKQKKEKYQVKEVIEEQRISSQNISPKKDSPIKETPKKWEKSKKESPRKEESHQQQEPKKQMRQSNSLQSEEPETQPQPENQSTLQKNPSLRKKQNISAVANYSHVYRKNSKKLLFFRNIYAFLASMVDETVELDEQGNQITSYLMIKQILRTINWLKAALQADKPSVQGLQRWQQYKKQSEYLQVKDYIEKQQNIFTVFGQTLESTVKQKCLKGHLGQQERKIIMNKSDETHFKKYLTIYIKKLTKKTLNQTLFTKDFNNYKRYWKHIEQMLVCLNYKTIFQDQTLDFNKFYQERNQATAEEILLKVEQGLIKCQ